MFLLKKESRIITHDPFNKYIQRLRDTSISLTTTYKYEHEISQRLFTCSNNHMFFFFFVKSFISVKFYFKASVRCKYIIL